jgi:DNA-binding CsgD family transcriptional regulator
MTCRSVSWFYNRKLFPSCLVPNWVHSVQYKTWLHQISVARSSLELCTIFMAEAGQLIGASAWGLDLIGDRQEIVKSDVWGLPDSFYNLYQKVGRDIDWMSQQMVRELIPIHNLSVLTSQAWQQSDLYQCLCQPYDVMHAMVAPLIGSCGLIGGIFFMRGGDLPAFCDRDLIHLSPLCQHLSVRFATLRLPIITAKSDLANHLTRRESEIVELVAQGLSNREIALKLGISRDGVKQALKRMFRKLDVSARAAMIAKLGVSGDLS